MKMLFKKKLWFPQYSYVIECMLREHLQYLHGPPGATDHATVENPVLAFEMFLTCRVTLILGLGMLSSFAI